MDVPAEPVTSAAPAAPDPYATPASLPAHLDFSERLPVAPAKPESFNPYASPVLVEGPSYQPSAEGGDFAIRPTRFTFSELMSITWQVFRTHIGMFTLLGAVLFGIFIAQQVVEFAIGLVGGDTNSPGVLIAIRFGAQVMNFLVQVATTLGGYCFCLRLLRTGRTSLSAFLGFTSFYWQGLLKDILVLIAGVGVAFVVMLPAIFVGVLGLNELVNPVFLICMLVLLCALAFLMLPVFVAGVFLVDKRLGATEALQESWRCSQGNRWPLFGALLVVGLLGGLFMICTLYLGMIVFLPYLSLLACVAYMLMAGQKEAISPIALGHYVTTPNGPY